MAERKQSGSKATPATSQKIKVRTRRSLGPAVDAPAAAAKVPHRSAAEPDFAKKPAASRRRPPVAPEAEAHPLLLALSGVLVAVDKFGQRLWEHRTPLSTQHVLVTPLHVLVVYGKVADRLDRTTGEIISRFPLPFAPQTIVADGEDVLFAVASNVLRVAPNGSVVWRISAEPEPLRTLGQISWMVMRDEAGQEKWRTEADAYYAGNPAQIVTLLAEPRKQHRKRKKE